MTRVWLLVALLACSVSAQAVVDCSRARSPIEKMLCSSQRAATADQRMAVAFRGAFARAADREALRADQLRWQAEVRDLCVEVDCLVKACEARSADLDDWR